MWGHLDFQCSVYLLLAEVLTCDSSVTVKGSSRGECSWLQDTHVHRSVSEM